MSSKFALVLSTALVIHKISLLFSFTELRIKDKIFKKIETTRLS